MEGATDDPAVLELRGRQRRNFLTTLLLSEGVPMMLGGDEIGRTQRGNNNGYCQDNEISWFDWEKVDRELLEFTRQLVRQRATHPIFRRRRWFEGAVIRGADKDIAWFTPQGNEMSDEDWQVGFAKSLGIFLNGQGIPSPGQQGERIVDRSFLLLFNAHHEPLEFQLPKRWGERWRKVIDTSVPALQAESQEAEVGGSVNVAGRSVVVLEEQSG